MITKEMVKESVINYFKENATNEYFEIQFIQKFVMYELKESHEERIAGLIDEVIWDLIVKRAITPTRDPLCSDFKFIKTTDLKKL